MNEMKMNEMEMNEIKSNEKIMNKTKMNDMEMKQERKMDEIGGLSRDTKRTRLTRTLCCQCIEDTQGWRHVFQAVVDGGGRGEKEKQTGGLEN